MTECGPSANVIKAQIFIRTSFAWRWKGIKYLSCRAHSWQKSHLWAYSLVDWTFSCHAWLMQSQSFQKRRAVFTSPSFWLGKGRAASNSGTETRPMTTAVRWPEYELIVSIFLWIMSSRGFFNLTCKCTAPHVSVPLWLSMVTELPSHLRCSRRQQLIELHTCGGEHTTAFKSFNDPFGFHAGALSRVPKWALYHSSFPFCESSLAWVICCRTLNSPCDPKCHSVHDWD